MAEFATTTVLAFSVALILVFTHRHYLESHVNQCLLSTIVVLTIFTALSGTALFCFRRCRWAINPRFTTTYCAVVIITIASYFALLHIYYLFLIPLALILILGATFYLRIDPTTADSIKFFGFFSAAFPVPFSGLLPYVFATLDSRSHIHHVYAIIFFLVCVVALLLVLISFLPPKQEDRNGRASLPTSNILKVWGIGLCLIFHLTGSTMSYVLFGGGLVAWLIPLVQFLGVWFYFFAYSRMQRRNVQQMSAIDTAAGCKLSLNSASISFGGLLAIFAYRSNDNAVISMMIVGALTLIFSFSVLKVLLWFEVPPIHNQSILSDFPRREVSLNNTTAHSDPSTEEYERDRKKSFGFLLSPIAALFNGTLYLRFHAELPVLLDIILLSYCVLAIALVLVICLWPKLEHMTIRALLPKKLYDLGLVLWLMLYYYAAGKGCIVLFRGGHVKMLAIALVPSFSILVSSAVHWWPHGVRHTSAIDTFADCEEHLESILGWTKVTATFSFIGLLTVLVSGDGSGGDGAVVAMIVVLVLNSFSISIAIMMLLLEAPKDRDMIAVIDMLLYCSTLVLVLTAVSIGAWIIKTK